MENIFNITPRKTFSLRPPGNLDYTCAVAYIVGFLDGDGWIYEDRGYFRLGFISSSKVILEWIKASFDRMVPTENKRIANVLKSKRGVYKSAVYTYSVGGKRALSVLGKLLSVDIPRLRRKWEKAAEKLNLAYDYYSF